MTDAEILDGLIARDAGKGSQFGISVDTLSAWRGKPVTLADVKKLTEKEARRIYEVRYLHPLEGVPEDLKPQLVDIAVELGVSRARLLLKAAQDNAGRFPVRVRLVVERLRFYFQAARRDPGQLASLQARAEHAVEFL